jgi:NADH-quinone oxidoreductase subunit N
MTDFLFLGHELGAAAILLLLLFADIAAAPQSSKQWLPHTLYTLFALHTIACFFYAPSGALFGGLYNNSPAAMMMKNILNIGALLVLLQTHTALQQPNSAGRRAEFYVIMLGTLLGMYIMVSAGNFMMLYIGIETASLPLACLAAFDKYKRQSAEAGAKYILTSAFSSAVMLMGISYVYGTGGSLYFADAAAVLTAMPLTLLGMVFFMTGLAFKISLVPFHLWTADVYQGAPTSVTAYLSVVSKGAAAFSLMVVLWKVFGSDALLAQWRWVLWVLAALSITIGNLFALRQKDIKRFFAFSSISQAGYISLGLMCGTAAGMTAVMYYVLVYIASNLAAFGVIAAVENRSGRTDIAACNGLYKASPVLAFVMMIAVFSLAGIPPFAGFFSKFFIFAAAVERGYYVLVFIALLNTVISLYYYLQIVRAMFINAHEEVAVVPLRADAYNRASMLLCAAGIVLLGIVSAAYGFVGNGAFGI